MEDLLPRLYWLEAGSKKWRSGKKNPIKNQVSLKFNLGTIFHPNLNNKKNDF